MKRPRRMRVIVTLRYARVLLKSFRWTLAALALALAFGTMLNHTASGLPWLTCAYGAWMALFAQPMFAPPPTWYLAIMNGMYPLLGFGLIGEGIVRIGLLMLSRRQGEKEWMKVMASTHRDHVVLCGLGHLGFRVLERLLAAGVDVVAVEKDEGGRFLAQAKATGIPILVRDMKDDQALIDAGVEHARAIIIATNDDMANIEVALDARRMNKEIRVIMRLFDQQIAGKMKDVFAIDEAFSASALAAPTVAAMSLDTHVVASFALGGVEHVITEVRVAPGSTAAALTVARFEQTHGVRVLAVRRGQTEEADKDPPAPARPLAAGDLLVLHARIGQLAELAAAARR